MLENEDFREEFFKKIRSIKNLYKTGKLVLNQSNIEKVLYCLDEKALIQAAGVAEREDTDVIERRKKR